MKASYEISETPYHLVKIGTPEFYISFLCGGEPDFDYERRAKHFYANPKEAESAGKRYLNKMRKLGFEV